VKLTTHLHVVPRSRMRRAIPPLPNTPSRRGARLEHRDAFLSLSLYNRETQIMESLLCLQPLIFEGLPYFQLAAGPVAWDAKTVSVREECPNPR
jgi:hypothetical protein